MNLKLERTKFGFTQQKLSEVANVSRATISLIERKKYIPSPRIAKKLAAVLTTVEWEDFYNVKKEAN